MKKSFERNEKRISCSGQQVCCGRDLQLWVWTTTVTSLVGISATLHARCFLYNRNSWEIARFVFIPVNICFSSRLMKNLTDTQVCFELIRSSVRMWCLIFFLRNYDYRYNEICVCGGNILYKVGIIFFTKSDPLSTHFFSFTWSAICRPRKTL